MDNRTPRRSRTPQYRGGYMGGNPCGNMGIRLIGACCFEPCGRSCGCWGDVIGGRWRLMWIWKVEGWGMCGRGGEFILGTRKQGIKIWGFGPRFKVCYEIFFVLKLGVVGAGRYMCKSHVFKAIIKPARRLVSYHSILEPK